MAFTYVNKNAAVSDGSTSNMSVSLTGVTAGNLIVVFLKHEGASVSITVNDGTDDLTPDTYNNLHSSSDCYSQFFYDVSANGGDRTYTASWTGTRPFKSIHVMEYSYAGACTFDTSNRNSADTGSPSSGNITSYDGNTVAFGGAGEYDAGTMTNFSINGSAADQTIQAGSAVRYMWSKTFSATYTGQATTGGTLATWVCNIISFKDVITAGTTEQEGFAFGTDDGSENAHTLNTQDADYSGPLGIKTLRAIVNMSGTTSEITPKLYYQKNGAGGYTAVPTSSTFTNSAADVTSTSITESGNNTATNTWTVTTVGANQGDLMIVHIAWDDSTNILTLTAPLGPGSETAQLLGSITADSGTAVRGGIWYYQCLSAWGASATLTFVTGTTSTEQWTAMVLNVPSGQYDPATPIGANTSRGDTTPLTNATFLPAMSAGSTDGGGRIVGFFVGDTNDVDQGTGTFPVILQRDRGACGATLVARPSVASNSEAIATTTGYTTPATNATVAFIYIIRPPSTTVSEVYISTSGNVAAGGETTTARLTAPAGKTTTSFSFGRRWDDENGLDTVTVSANSYTEVEHVLTTQSPATTSDYFDFRYYNGDSAFDTYTVTPRWTIAAASGGAATGYWIDRSYPRGVMRGTMRGVA